MFAENMLLPTVGDGLAIQRLQPHDSVTMASIDKPRYGDTGFLIEASSSAQCGVVIADTCRLFVSVLKFIARHHLDIGWIRNLRIRFE